MSKYEDKKIIGNDDYNNNSSEFRATAQNSFQNKNRKDAKGNLILKKKNQNINTKHHAYFIDTIAKNKKLVEIIDIESYKKFNLMDEEIEDKNENGKENNEQKLEESKVVVKQGCCQIF